MLELIILIIVIISFILFIFTIYYNKYQLVIIKIDKAEEDISLYLQRKQELLERVKPILKKDYYLSSLEEINEDFNNFELHDILKRNYNELFKVMDENEKLLKSESLVQLLENLNTNEENIVGSIKFYNDTVVEFNQLVVSFPSSIIGFFKNYKKLEFYNNEKREIFEILNND